MIKEKILKTLAISLVFILSIIYFNQISFANITENQNKGNINVSNIEQGVNVYLYQIATMDYDYVSNQPKEGYQWNTAIQSWMDENFPAYSNTEKFYEKVENNSEEAKSFYDKLTAAMKENTIQISAYREIKATGEAVYPVTNDTLKGIAKFSEVDMGTYLVMIENGYMVYTPSVVNLVPSYDSDTKQWILEDSNVVIKATNPTITKTFTNEERLVDNYSTVDTISYTIKADVPTYLENSLSKKYCISDKLDNSFTINEDSLVIYGLKSGSEPVSITGHTIKFNTTRPNSTDEVTFLIDFDYSTVSSYETIEIVYTAQLNKDNSLILGETGNNNYSYLDYSNNPYVKSSVQTQRSDQVTVYTYGIEIKSVDGEDNNKPLPGSEFCITDEKGDILHFVKGDEGEYYLADPDDEGATTNLTVDENGNLSIKGLDEGTYKVKQTKAPEGCNVSSKSYNVELVDKEPDGVLDKEYSLLFPNTRGFILPVTGGRGIVALVSTGVVLLGIGMMLVVSICKKRKILEEKVEK